MIIDFLAFIGALALLMIGAVVLTMLACLIEDRIAVARRKYQYKHRFDKKPLAKCYCIDCDRRDIDSGKCYWQDKWVLDNEFCSNANPRAKDPLEEKGEPNE